MSHFCQLNRIISERLFKTSTGYQRSIMRIETEELINELWDNIYAAAYSITGNRMDAEDAAQDAFVRYHMHNKQFEGKEHIRAWLFKTAINRAKDLTRSLWKKNKVSFEEYMENAGEAEDSSEALIRREESIRLTSSVFSLPEKYRIVIHLYYYEEYSAVEIARILGITEANVRKRLSRAREMLRHELSEEFEND